MDDNDIIQLYWDRNDYAIRVTSEKYGHYCKSIAKNILNNDEDAEECVNDTYLNAWNSMPTHWPEQLSTFLGKITGIYPLTSINTTMPKNVAAVR